MYVGMKLDAFKKEWLKHFASNISKRDIENKVVKQAGISGTFFLLSWWIQTIISAAKKCAPHLTRLTKQIHGTLFLLREKHL